MCDSACLLTGCPWAPHCGARAGVERRVPGGKVAAAAAAAAAGRSGEGRGGVGRVRRERRGKASLVDSREGGREGGRRWNLKGTFLASYNTVYFHSTLCQTQTVYQRVTAGVSSGRTGKEFTEHTPGGRKHERGDCQREKSHETSPELILGEKNRHCAPAAHGQLSGSGGPTRTLATPARRLALSLPIAAGLGRGGGRGGREGPSGAGGWRKGRGGG